jgi:hypothetical protein
MEIEKFLQIKHSETISMPKTKKRMAHETKMGLYRNTASVFNFDIKGEI